MSVNGKLLVENVAFLKLDNPITVPKKFRIDQFGTNALKSVQIVPREKRIFIKTSKFNVTSETEKRVIYVILPLSAPTPTDSPIHYQSFDDSILM